MPDQPPTPPPDDPENPGSVHHAKAIATPSDCGAKSHDYEAIRKKYLGHEASVKTTGSLFMIGAILWVAASVVSLMAAAGVREPSGVLADEQISPNAMAWQGTFMLAIGLLYLAVAIGLYKLRSWAQWVTALIVSLGLFYLLVVDRSQYRDARLLTEGSISVYILYIVLSPKGGVVFSPEYKEAIARTPHIKYRVSPLTKYILTLVVTLVALLSGMVMLPAILGSLVALEWVRTTLSILTTEVVMATGLALVLVVVLLLLMRRR
jgi:hypothetical protein